MKNLVITKLYTNGSLSVADYNAKTFEITTKLAELRAERKKLLGEERDRQIVELIELNETIKISPYISEFNEELFNATIDKIIVGSDNLVTFCLVGGLKIKEKVFATRIGMRGRKFNVVMGETVKIADSTEDEIAGVCAHCSKTEIAITKEMFLELKSVNSKQSHEYEKLFSNRKVNGQEYYVCTTGFRTFQKNADFKTQNQNAETAKDNNGIKPWGI